MRVYLTTLGCRLNEAELESWSRQFEAGGHIVVGSAPDAQVMIVNTCAVTGEAASKSRKLVSGLHRRNPSAPVVVTGCYGELSPERAAAQAGVDLLVPNRDKDRLVDRVLAEVEPAHMPMLATEAESAHVYRDARTRAFIKVQDGCRNRCTFCIVTIARGQERSRAIADVVAEINAVAATGHTEVVLTGVHLGGYGSDLGTSLRELVEAVLADTDVPRVRLSSLEPWDLPEGFERLWANPRLMPHLHLPIQSGSDAVLKKMARRCSTEEYARLVDGFRAAIDDLTITTDIIVGFPGETDDDFSRTMDFVHRIGFGHIHIFAYSRRDGTTAARLGGHVTTAIKRERSRELHAAAADLKRAHHLRFVGDMRSVLWEGAGTTTETGERRFAGYTDNYLRVETWVPARVDLENRITDVRLDAAGDGVLIGEIVGEVATRAATLAG
jgi:threonylcarbamoyladenosine tRNA methylthiotransferase MtaB